MSEIKVNKISPRAACGTTTLGDSGDTFTIPAGVTITNNGTANGFGATGAVNWQTTVKTGTFTATAGEGYFVNTTSGGFNVNLPAGTAGAVVGFKDYANTFDTANLTLVPSGSDKIGGNTGNVTISKEGIAVTLVFVDATKGWLVTDDGLQSSAPGPLFVTATGGTVTTSGNFKVHVFTSPGTFCVSCNGNSQGANTVDYLVVAGGGGAGAQCSGGGGGGGFRLSNSVGCIPAPTMSPLANPTGLTVSAIGYPIVVGGGGAAKPYTPGTFNKGNPGSNSSFDAVTSAGGGGGASGHNINAIPGNDEGQPGGSGGGGMGANPINPAPGAPSLTGVGGTGNTPPVSPPQGNPGGAGTDGFSNYHSSAGGGGAGAAGSNSPAFNAPPGSRNAGPGGVGGFVSPSFAVGCAGTPGPAAGRYFAGGGGGGTDSAPASGGTGGSGGGGGGSSPSSPGTGTAGTTNTGGGGGGGQGSSGGSTGGSGIVIIRYKFQ